MKMRKLFVTCFVLTGLLACKPQSSSIDIAFLNQTTNEFDFVEITFGENTCSAGVLIPTAPSVTMDYRYPITPEAKVRWKRSDGVVKIKEVALKGVVPPKTTGRITFSIHEDSVTVTFKPK